MELEASDFMPVLQQKEQAASQQPGTRNGGIICRDVPRTSEEFLFRLENRTCAARPYAKMAISAELVKHLRDKTGAGMADCKKALEEADGDEQKAIEVLRKKGRGFGRETLPIALRKRA